MSYQGISCMGLTDITFIFMNSDVIIVFVTKRSIVAFIGKVKKEKILPMKWLIYIRAIMDTNYNFFIRISWPFVRFFFWASSRNIQIFPVATCKMFSQTFD